MEVCVVQPGLIDVYNAHAAVQGTEHKLGIHLPQKETPGHVAELRHLVDALETQTQITTENFANVSFCDFHSMLLGKNLLDLSCSLQPFFRS